MNIEYYKEQLASKEEMLAQTTGFLVNTQQLLEEKNRDLSSVNKDIFDSIEFASIIQKSLLPDINILKVFFKDAAYRVIQQIGIGGDNVFIKSTNRGVMFGLMDSTGHGIPAALLSISGTVILRELIYSMEISDPRALLRLLNQQMHTIFNQNSGYKIAHKEGIIFHYCTGSKKLTYSSAKGKCLHLKQSGEIVSLASNKYSVGEDPHADFELHEVTMAAGEKLIMYTDGLQDQFGGRDNKKFTSQRLKKTLEAGTCQSATELARYIEREFVAWKGNNSQTDDVSFIIIDF